MDIHTIVFDNRSWRCQAVFWIQKNGVAEPEYFGVDDFAPNLDVICDQTQGRGISFANGSREPDTAACNYRRGPSQTRNRSLPLHIARFAPLERQATLARVTLSCRAAKLWPVLGVNRQCGQSKNERQETHAKA